MKKKSTESLTLFAEVSPASPSAAQESEKERMMTVTSGRRCYALYGKLSPLSSLLKTLLESSAWTAERYSKKYALIWKVKGTPFNRLLFQLSPKERRTDGTEFGLLLKTPSAMDGQTSGIKKTMKFGSSGTLSQEMESGFVMNRILPTPKKQNANSPAIHGKGGLDLQTYISILPTPAARDYKGANSQKHLDKKRGHHDQLPNAIKMIGTITGLKLQPSFVEWMMGYPTGWTVVSERQFTKRSGTSAEKKLKKELDLICEKLKNKSSEQND